MKLSNSESFDTVESSNLIFEKFKARLLFGLPSLWVGIGEMGSPVLGGLLFSVWLKGVWKSLDWNIPWVLFVKGVGV